MKTIITGITGQDGSYLADLLLSKGYKVIGVSRRTSTDNTQRIKHILSHPGFSLIQGDITDMSSVLSILKDNADVDEIYNLAAQSHVAVSFKQPGLTWDITGKGCINVLECIVKLNMLNVRFYQASSSEMYGKNYDTKVILDKTSPDYKKEIKYQDENTKFLPQSPYAIAKCAAHYAVRMYREAYGLHASSGILFNHESPRRGDDFVTKKITNWITRFQKWLKHNNIKAEHISAMCKDGDLLFASGIQGSFPKLRLGNLDACRDWGYAGDYVDAMWRMLQQEYPSDYVICTGVTHTVRDFLELCFNYINVKDWEDLVYIDPEFYRPAEVDYLQGDSSKARTSLDWTPSNDLSDLVKMMLDNDKF